MADSNVYQPVPQYSLQLVAGQSNPWLLPEKQEPAPNYRPLPKYQSQQYQGDENKRQQYQGTEINKYGQGYRFVTPEILESLKQQQIQNQLMPGDRQNQKYIPRQYNQGNYGYPSNSMRYSDPVYSSPVVSPWGSGPEVLYRGESFPWVPNEAIGGIPPIHVPSIGEDSYLGKSNNAEKQKEINIFNPFTFIQDGNLP